MPFTKVTPSQQSYYDAVACLVWNNWTAKEKILTPSQNPMQNPLLTQMQVQHEHANKLFGLCVVGESATELLEFSTQRWWPLPHCGGKDNGSCTACATTFVGAHIYKVGGLLNVPNHEVTTSCHVLEFGATEWKALPDMTIGRCYAAAIGIGNLLYVVGGRGRSTPAAVPTNFFTQLNSLEVYNTTTQEWMTKAPMSTPRMAPGIFKFNETKIAIIGGYSDRGEWETSVEYYDIPTDTWTSQGRILPPMESPAAFPKAVAITSRNKESTIDRIIVVGTCMLRPNSSYASHTTIWSLDCGSKPDDAKWIKLTTSNPKNLNKVLLPNEGCAIAFDPDSHTLYSVGGRGPKGCMSSNQTLAWNVPSDEAMLVKDIKVPLLGLTVPGNPPTTNSPRKQKRQHLHRQMTAVRIGCTGRLASNPISSREGDGDETSCQESEMGDGEEITSPSSVFTNRGHARQNYDETKAASPENGNIGINSGDVEENGQAATFHTTGMIWTDRMGNAGRYTGGLRTVDNDYSIAPHGFGRFVASANGDIFEGGWRNGRRHGQGRWEFGMTGDVFEGRFLHDRKNGRGNYQSRDGRSSEGYYTDDQAEDLNGTLTWKDGTLYVGAFRKGQRTGRGSIQFPGNGVRYVGEFRKGKYDGLGTCMFEDSMVYSGYWRKGKAHGRGKLINADGIIIHEGQWDDDAPVL